MPPPIRHCQLTLDALMPAAFIAAIFASHLFSPADADFLRADGCHAPILRYDDAMLIDYMPPIYFLLIFHDAAAISMLAMTHTPLIFALRHFRRHYFHTPGYAMLFMLRDSCLVSSFIFADFFRFERDLFLHYAGCHYAAAYLIRCRDAIFFFFLRR